MTTIVDACEDPELFGPWCRDRSTWAAWFAFLAALFGLPMTEEQAVIFRECTGRGEEEPTEPATEGWLICGRRSGKSFVLALLAVFLACFRDYRLHLAPGERATVLVLATDRKQARVIVRYIRALLHGVPMLKAMVAREVSDAFDLNNSVSIEVGSASFRSTRGYTFAAVLADELAFWPGDDSAEPDYEILDAVRPGLATIPGAMLLCASSPYSRRGAIWDAFRLWWGQPVRELVWRAPTRRMNPTVAQSIIDRAAERDPSHAAAEYGAEFRVDIETFVSREAIEAIVPPDLRERAPVQAITYGAFVDPSGGSSDSMTLAIAHRDGAVRVLDAIRERRAPFSPESVVDEFAALLKRYRVGTVIGDRYAGEWVREPFRRHGIEYRVADRPKSDLYRDVLPLINSGEAELLDEPRLIAQFCGLERRTARSGRDSIDHAPGSHDDVCNAAAGALVCAITRRQPSTTTSFAQGMF